MVGGRVRREIERDQQWDRRARNETPEERADRQYGELLQEMRVAQTGVQILLGFLFSVAFTPRFAQLGTVTHGLYVATLLTGAASAATLIAPVAAHRMMVGLRMKPELVGAANILVRWGLGFLLLTIVCGLTLVLTVVLGLAAGSALGAVSAATFVACWYLLPRWIRNRAGQQERQQGVDGPRSEQTTGDRSRTQPGTSDVHERPSLPVRRLPGNPGRWRRSPGRR